MKTILIALDYNPTAQKVADTGHNLARAMNAKPVLMHVISDTTYYSYANYSPIMGFEGFNGQPTTPTDATEELKDLAQEYLEKSKRHLGDETIQTVVEKGDFGESILNTAAKVKADLIVMGTHSRRGLEKILMGSVAEYVLRRTSIPVLIIPTKSV
jgi:nucleotide-binding universal stress UspA family protein